MANEPSLSEFTNMAADPERGTGHPAVVFDDRDLSRQLNQSAQYKAESDWRKYNFFLGNLKDMYKDVNEIAKQPIMQEDQPELRGQMADIVKEIGQNPQGFFGGGPKFNDIQGKIAQLQSRATESRGNQLFNEAHRQAMLRNPEWNSDENKALIDGFGKQKLGSRQLYQFDLPGLYDPTKLAEKINANVKSESSYSRPTPDNQFIEKGKDVIYDPVKFGQLADQAYYQADERGVPLAKTIQKRFDAFPEEVKGQFKDAKDWFVQDLKSRIMNNSSSKDDLVPNPGYLEKEKLAQKVANDRGELAVKWANYGIAKKKADEASGDDLNGADSVINEAVSMIKKGDVNSVIEGAGAFTPKSGDFKNVKNKFELGDPSTLQTFGKVNKDGTVYDVPDRVLYNKQTKQLELVFDEHKDKKGKTIAQDIKPLNEREWLSLIVKRKFPNKDIGGINSLVESVLQKNGSIYDLSKKFDENGTFLKTYKFNGKDVSEKAVNDAAAQWGLSPEEYRKKFKIE